VTTSADLVSLVLMGYEYLYQWSEA
jgi:hypothetical protein